MRKFFFTMVALLGMAVSSQAMSYEQARQQALFLADKMAYELNLTDEQYEACYEVNLDYFMGVNSQADLFGDYWTRRNLDISYILADWQYQMFLDAAYFYRPLYWDAGFWHFRIYARYPHRDYFYFGCPHFYHVYRGGHAWGMNGGHSWYHGRDFGHKVSRNHFSGMRDGFNNGRYGRGGNMNSNHGMNPGRGNDHRGVQSSTRSTVGSRGNHMSQQHNNTAAQRGNSSVQRTTEGSRRGQVFNGNGTSVQRTTATPKTRTESVNRSSGFSSGAQRSNTAVQRSSSSVQRSNSGMQSRSYSSGSTRSAGSSMGSSSRGGGSSHGGGGSHGGGFGGGRH